MVSRTDKEYDIRVGRFGRSNEKVVGFDVPVNERLVVYGLNTGDLGTSSAGGGEDVEKTHTICLASMQTVLMENLRPHMSKRSSRFGPRRSMTRTL